MTTTHSTTPGTGTSSVPATPRQQRLEKAVEAAKRFAFPIFLLVVTGITASVLTALGLAKPAAGVVDASYSYDGELAVVIFIYNLVIMVWPLVLAVKMAFDKRPHIVPRLAVIVGSVILTLPPVMDFWINLFSGVGKGLWAFPITGFLVCAAALLLHGAAAHLLTRYAAVNPQLTEHRQTKQSLEGIVRKDGTIVQPGLIQTARTESINAQAALTAQSDIVDNHETEAARLQGEVDRCSEATTKAKEALDATTLNTVDLPAAKAAVEAMQTKISEQQAVVDALKIRVKTALPADRGARQAELDQAKREHDALIQALPDLQRNVNDVEAAIASSPEKAAYDAALAASNVASSAATAHNPVVEAANKKLTEATDANKAAASKLEDLEKQLVDVNNLIAEDRKSTESLWGDVVFWPVVCVILAIAADSSFYGWVAVTVAGAHA